ncbi:hypothetical protein K443DRAFT_674443 [Laccaria amethystina LaAM-08-1]|uniref:Uncharacterized protein n=1 Tax=Laccaria amethystina LaAM-08-1 TaxID=1095629 RepID=A0A0C9YD85_9AGAR|nr:hypothetical protein K443DRAFT_674443 [Laccaria amethystina LaAM-08-1]
MTSYSSTRIHILLTSHIYKELGDREHLVSDVTRFFTWLRRTLSGRVFIGVDSSCVPTRRHTVQLHTTALLTMCLVSASRMIAPNYGLHLSARFNSHPSDSDAAILCLLILHPKTK